MNFQSLQTRDINIATPASRVSNFRVLSDGAAELAHAQGQMGVGIAQGFNKLKDQVETTQCMAANNMYNELMSQGTAELMQNKEEAALNLTEQYDKLQKETLQKVQKQYGSVLRFGAGAQAFNEYTMRDNAARRANILKYQLAQTEAYRDTQFNNQLASCQQMVLDGGGSDEAIAGACNRADGLIAARYANYGSEMIEQQKRLIKGQMVASALSLAVGTSNYARMGELSTRYNNLLDPKTRVAVLSMLGKRQKEAHERAQANDVWLDLGRNATRDDVKEWLLNRRAKEGTLQNFYAVGDSLCGQEMENGRNGCVEFAMKCLSKLTGFGANNSGERNVGNLFRAASADGSGATVMKYNGQKAQAGDILVYATPGDDISNPDNLEHVTVSDGNGGYYGNSSGARDYEDENGNYIKGNGCGVHSDSQDIGGYEIAYIIRPDDMAAKEMSDLEIEEETDKLWAQYSKRENEMAAAENRVIKQAKLEMQDLMNNGVMDVGQYQAIVNKYAFQNGVVDDNIRIPLEAVVAAEERRQERAAAQAAKGAPSAKVTEAHLDFMREKISEGGMTEAGILSFCAEQGITSPSEVKKLTKLMSEYQENKGEWAINYDDIRSYCDIDDKHITDKKAFNKTFKRMVRWQYKLMLRDNHGQLPSDWEADLAQRTSDALTNEYHGGTYVDKGIWLNTDEPVNVPWRELAAAGYETIRQTGEDGYVLEGSNGQYAFMTGKDLMELKEKGLSGYVD